MNNILTYRDLLNELTKLNNEQLDSNLAVHLLNNEEFYSSSNGCVDFDFTVGDDILDDNHPVFLVKNF